MRTTKELIEELHSVADCLIVALVIGFENTTDFVFQSKGTKAEQVEKLNSAIKAGGEPIGLLAVKQGPESGGVVVRLFQEHKGNQGLMEYMHTLAASFVAQAEKDGHVTVEKQS